MKNNLIISTVFIIISVLFTNAFCEDTTRIIYNDFSDLSLWQLNNDCAGATNSNSQKVLRLTPDERHNAGSAFLKESISLVSENGFKASFSASFSFQISKSDGMSDLDGVGADGIVFVVQTIDNTVGNDGGGIGYHGIENSIGIEFDTWYNDEETNLDPDGNHVGLDINGLVISKKTISEKKRFNDGDIWYVWIDYDGDKQILEIRYDTVNKRPSSFNLSDTIDLPSILKSQNVYVGFTSGTGGGYGLHDILSFNFVNKFQPFTYEVSLSAHPDTIVNVNEQVTLTATVHDMNGMNRPDSAMKTKWRIIDSGNNPSSILKSSNGAEVLLVPTVENSIITVEGSVVINGKQLIDTIAIRVKALEVFTLKISARPDTIVMSHDSITLVSEIFDRNNTSVIDSAEKTTWRIIQSDENPMSVLRSTLGSSVWLAPVVPYSTIKIEASITLNGKTLKDTIAVRVTAGAPHRIVIESNYADSDLDFLRNPHPLDTISLVNYPETVSVYAVVRDAWGGFCRLSDPTATSWSVITGSTVVEVYAEEAEEYLGHITRNGSQGMATISASEENLISDTAQVVVKNLFISEIQIRDHENGSVLESLSMNVQESRILDAYALIAGKESSDQSSWLLIEGDWSVSEGITDISIPAPKNSSTWTFGSNNGATGTITVQSNIPFNASKTIPVTIISEQEIIISALSNPSYIEKTIIDNLSIESDKAKILSIYNNVINSNDRGVLVAVYSKIALKKLSDSFGVAVVYDCVGNIIAKDLKLQNANSDTKTDYALHWDGTNRQNRVVGAGSYLVRVSVVDANETRHVLQTKIGIAD